MDHSESVCSISGCVISLSELKAEWGALDRTQQPLSSSSAKGNKRAHHADIHDNVEVVVREILDSSKTLQCMKAETERDNSRKAAFLVRIIREFSAQSNRDGQEERPNLIDMEAQLSWQCRKCRSLLSQAKLGYFCFVCVMKIAYMMIS